MSYILSSGQTLEVFQIRNFLQEANCQIRTRHYSCNYQASTQDFLCRGYFVMIEIQILGAFFDVITALLLHQKNQCWILQ